jgi:hypothetical protein
VAPQAHRHAVVKANVGMAGRRVAVCDFVTDCRRHDDILEGCGFDSSVVDHEVATAYETSVALGMAGESDMAFAEGPLPTQPKSHPHWQYADDACHSMRPPHPDGPHIQRTQRDALAGTWEVECRIAPKAQTCK